MHASWGLLVVNISTINIQLKLQQLLLAAVSMICPVRDLAICKLAYPQVVQ